MSNIEAELKLRLADPSCQSSLLTAPLLRELATQLPCKQTLATTYYDTADRRLLKSRLSYRLRSADGEWTATVKADGTSDGGLHQRFEYNVPVKSPQPSIEPFLLTDIGGRLAEAAGDRPLEPVFSTCFERSTMEIITPDGSTIELALDAGNILAGDKQQEILELELELQAGQPQALIWLGTALATQFPLLPEQDSKLYRATVLAGLADSLAQDIPLPSPLTKASAVLPAPRALSEIMIHTIHRTISAQQAYLANPDDREVLHNFRMVLCKLHSLLQFAEPLMPPEEYTDWQNKLSTWNRKLGRLRDLDEFSLTWDQLTGYTLRVIPNYSGKPVLTEIIAAKRKDAKNNFHTAVATGELTPVLLGLWSFLLNWAATGNNQVLCKRFAYLRFGHWLTSLLQQGNELDLSDLAAVHELRIDGRCLRYTLEALAPVLPDSSRLLVRRLEQLQDILGKIRDVAFTPLLLQELVKASSSRLSHRDAGLITGWQLARSAAAQPQWDKAWAKLNKAVTKQKKLKPLADGSDEAARQSN